MRAPPTGARVLVADDTPVVRDLLARVLTGEGHDVVAVSDGEAALAALAGRPVDIVLLDVVMPGLDGFAVCRRIKSDPATRLIPVVLVTGLGDVRDRIEGIEAGADEFLTKPINVHELRARVRSLVRLKRFTDELESAESLILGLALMVEARDSGTGGHCQRLAGYATALGEHLGLDEADIAALHRGGFLHDIGKIALPDSILMKPGALTAEEFEQMKRHTVIGDRLCRGMRSLQAVCPIVRHHHERYDGSGYPDGLRGDDIPLLAQILAIVDVFDALVTERPYKPAFTVDRALERLAAETALGWRRADLVEQFTALVRSGGARGLPGPGCVDPSKIGA